MLSLYCIANAYKKHGSKFDIYKINIKIKLQTYNSVKKIFENIITCHKELLFKIFNCCLSYSKIFLASRIIIHITFISQ